MIRRLRNRISTVILLLALACVYLSLWSVTDQFGVEEVRETYDDAHSSTTTIDAVHRYESISSPAPFIVAVKDFTSPDSFLTVPWRRVYYLWTPWTLTQLPWAYDIRVPSAEVAGQQPVKVLVRCPDCDAPVHTVDSTGFENSFSQCTNCGRGIDQ